MGEERLKIQVKAQQKAQKQERQPRNKQVSSRYLLTVLNSSKRAPYHFYQM